MLVDTTTVKGAMLPCTRHSPKKDLAGNSAD